MRLIGEIFPLLICVAPRRYDAEEVQRMAEAFEVYHARGERYALVSVQPQDSIAPGANERKLITDWVNSPRVRQCTHELCVGAAAVIKGPIMRGALTAVLWFWTPPTPLKVFATPGEGLDYCLTRLNEAGLVLPEPADSLRIKAVNLLEPALREAG